MNTIISFFESVREKAGSDMPVDIFLQRIRDGYWQDQVLAVRTGRMAKNQLPIVTVSGTFSERRITGLTKHSGLICIDIDNVEDVNETKAILCADRHVYACFVSAGGKGIAAIFKINPSKQRESFDGLQEHLYNNYQIVADPSCKDVSRARFVTYDPHIFINEGATKFTQYPKAPPPALKKLPHVVYVQDDFDNLISEIAGRRIDITGAYHDWLRIAFAIADKHGEAGRGAFHAISQFSLKYNASAADKQYTNCLKAGKSGITIATLYWYAKQAGLEVASERTKLISQVAARGRAGKVDRNDIVRQLFQFEDIPQEQSEDIVNQIYDNPNVVVESDESMISEVETWLRHNYHFRRNSLSRKIECNGVIMEVRHFNTVFIAAKKIFDKLTFETMERIINSDFTQDYNPLTDWFAAHTDRTPSGVIHTLARTLKTDMSFDYVHYFLRKWLVGIVQAAHTEPSALMLVLSGAQQNTGKTTWFRRLLPREIRQYYAESKLDAGKDDELLMCEKLIIMDDEMGGKSKRDTMRLKELTSKKWFSLREPYGKFNVDRRRLAVLAGTANDNQILNDPTGNRRIIPVNVLDIDKELYNSIDKTDIFMEAYHAWRAGETSELSKSDIDILNSHTSDFAVYSPEYELLIKYYTPAKPTDSFNIEFMTATDIKSNLEKWSQQKLNIRQLGMELRKAGFVRVGRNDRYGYQVIERGKTDEPMPFG